jgi:hypothetical protein
MPITPFCQNWNWMLISGGHSKNYNRGSFSKGKVLVEKSPCGVLHLQFTNGAQSNFVTTAANQVSEDFRTEVCKSHSLFRTRAISIFWPASKVKNNQSVYEISHTRSYAMSSIHQLGFSPEIPEHLLIILWARRAATDSQWKPFSHFWEANATVVEMNIESGSGPSSSSWEDCLNQRHWDMLHKVLWIKSALWRQQI